MARNIAFLIYPDFQLLDAAGPIAAFEIAERHKPGTYALHVVAEQPGLVASSSGASMQAGAFWRAGVVDTLVISGGDGSREASASAKTRRFVLRCGTAARRVTSVCSGTFVLAAAGLLDGKSATTHWSRSSDFARKFPKVRLDPDRIFVKEDKIWTSAGITAGIDLALAMIGEDLGEEIARRTAQQLVVYYRRPGGQSQFSPLLQMERADGRFASLLDHVRGNLGQRLSVTDLAKFSCMSPRNFSRAFRAEIGVAPAKAVERLRVDTARAALQSGAQSIQRVAQSCGFGEAERMRRSFMRILGALPSALKRGKSRLRPAGTPNARGANPISEARGMTIVSTRSEALRSD
ncbi:MAG: GlxA family transcriptional regulator [Steroidobacterales bacterium]